MSAPFSDDCIKFFSFSYLSDYFFSYIAIISSAKIKEKIKGENDIWSYQIS